MKNKLKSLHLFDVVILAIIFFGFAIYSSNMQFFELISHEQVAPETLEFNSSSNWSGILSEIMALLVAFGYLTYRKFDFKQLNFSVNRWTLPKWCYTFSLQERWHRFMSICNTGLFRALSNHRGTLWGKRAF